MAGGKETPRQKMIGMMYLVLLALLAMQMSKEVLLSFVVINDAMEQTNEALAEQNASTMAEFEKQNSINPEKVGKWLDKAQTVVSASDELNQYITDLKKVLIAQTEAGAEDNETAKKNYVDLKTEEGIPKDSVWNLQFVESKDKYDEVTTIMIGPEPASPKEGPFTALELKSKMQEFDSKIESSLPDKYKANWDMGFNFDPIRVARDEVQEWESANFYHVPISAVITNLSRYQAEAKKIEGDALKLLFSEISAEDFKFDTLAVKVIPNSNYVTLGDSFKADVIVAAYSTTDNPKLEVGQSIDTSSANPEDWKVLDPLDTSRVHVENGVAQYAYKPTTAGEVEWGGFIKIRKPGSEEYVPYPFKHKFIAAKPSTVVSPVKMNVVYRGLWNPIDVSVAGFSAQKIKASASNAQMKQVGPGQYEVKPGNGQEVKVNVQVQTEDGGTKSMGEPFTFRVKNIPKPEPFFAGQTGKGSLPGGALKVGTKVNAVLKDFDFEGVKYNVVEFTVSTLKAGRYVSRKSNSAKVTSEQRALLDGLGRGDRVTFENIWAVGPDGQRKNIGNIIIDVK
jgi:gliding motility-associated protein GldM